MGDVVLIEDDKINYLDNFDGATVNHSKIGSADVLNVIHRRDDAVQFRREVALHKDGRLELTMKMQLYPYKNDPEIKHLSYSFRVPLSVLAGSKFTARIDRVFRAKTVSGTLLADRKDGNLTATKCRFIAFEKDDQQLVFDANPYGVMSMQDYCMYGEPVGAWTVKKEGDWVVFSFGQTARFYGGIFTSKMVIYKGTYDYDLKHPHDLWGYHGSTPAQHQFSFATKADTKDFKNADLLAYTKEQGWGWDDPSGLEMIQADSPAVIDHCVTSANGASRAFLLDVTPGVYVLSLRLGHNESAIGPFSILVNDKLKMQDISLLAGQTKEVLLPHYVHAPQEQLAIGFSGPGAWAVRSLVVQAVIFQNQDFALDRDMWVTPDMFEPQIKLSWFDQKIASNSDKAQQYRAFPVALSNSLESESGSNRRAMVRTQPEVMLPPDSDELAWRYDMKMGDLAGAVSGMLYDLYTPELIERRIKEMSAGGINTVIISGLHMHHCFLPHWPAIIAFVKKVTQVAHQHGMKVIFHHDVPVVYYSGTGLQHMLDHLDWLSRDIEFGRPTLRSYCIMNPQFRAAYFERMLQLTRDSGMDGGMLDEGVFPGKEFCGCEHCRRSFTALTGLVMPRKNTSKVFYNQEEPVWNAWLKWRKRVVGDFWVELRKVLNEANPEFCNMKYTTHYGFTSNWSMKTSGADLVESARACDSLGTEIMARNVYDSRRGVYAYRKMKSALGNLYNLPIWGLVYHLDDPVFAYFGWAMNHMNRQTTWLSMIEGENMARYMDWSDRMINRRAKPVADVAVLYSVHSRDFARMFSSSADPLGVSQCLTDAHIQHDFVLDQDILNRGKLHQYNLVILASIGNLASDQIQSLRTYVKEGGALLVTTNTSLFDDQGFKQDNFQLADVMGVDYSNLSTVRGPRTMRFGADGSTLVFSQGLVRVEPRKGAQVQAEFINDKGTALWPAIVRNRYGQGTCLYLPMALGSTNFESEWGTGRTMTFTRNDAMADLLIRLIHETARAPFDFKVVAVPQAVMISVYQQEIDGKREMLIHLLNATGTGVPTGTAMPSHKDWTNSKPAFPPLKKDIVFDIHISSAKSASIASPDYDGARPVAMTSKGKDWYRVTVKAVDLSAYAIVRIECSSIPK